MGECRNGPPGADEASKQIANPESGDDRPRPVDLVELRMLGFGGDDWHRRNYA